MRYGPTVMLCVFTLFMDLVVARERPSTGRGAVAWDACLEKNAPSTGRKVMADNCRCARVDELTGEGLKALGGYHDHYQIPSDRQRKAVLIAKVTPKVPKRIGGTDGDYAQQGGLIEDHFEIVDTAPNIIAKWC